MSGEPSAPESGAPQPVAPSNPPGLPMPRDLAMVLDPSRRPRARRPNGRRFPFPIPNGWFIVAEAHELEPGETLPLHVFGRELVLVRTESGEPRVVDA